MASKTIQTILALKDKYSSGMKKAAGNTKETQRSIKLLHNNINSFKNSAVSSFGSIAKSAAGMAVAFTGINVLSGSVMGAIDSVKEYSSSLRNLQAATGASTKEMSAMKAEITDLYKQNFGQNWTDLADAMIAAKQVTGQAGDALEETTKNALIYRDTFKTEIPDSIKAVDTMMKQFGITSTQAYNLLAQGNQKGLDKTGELLDTANEYSVYFKTIGFDANQMFDIFGSGLKSGAFNLDKVGDSVKEFGIRIKDNSKGTKSALQSLGLNADRMMQTFAKGGPDAQKAFKTVVNAISSVKDPVQKNTLGVQLFGTQFEDVEKDVVAAMGTARSEFDMTKGTMEEINNVKFNDIGSAFQGIKRQIETGILIPIGEKLLPKLNEFSSWINSHMPEIKKSIDSAFSTGAKVANKIGDAFGWAKKNADWLVPAIAAVTAAIVAQKVINGVVKAYDAWKVVTEGLTIAQTVLKTVSLASPFGWIALAIGVAVAAGILLYKNWDTIIASAKRLGASIASIWGNIMIYITGVVTNIGNWLDSFPLGRGFLVTIQRVISNVKTIFSGFITFFTSVFKGNWKGAWEGIVQVFKGTFGLIAAYAKAPLNAIIGLVNTLIAGINKINIKIPDWVPSLGGKEFGINIPQIPQFATGTPYFKGGPARTDEHGGEIKEYPNGTKIIPHDISLQMAKGQGTGLTVNLTIQGNVIGNEQFAGQIGDYIYRKLVTAQGNV